MSKRNSKRAVAERTNPEIRHGRHCVFLMHAHLVFVTKYRKDVLTAELLAFLKPIFESVCKDFDAELVEFEGEHDHVHLLINYPPKHPLSKIVNLLKGIAARRVRSDPKIKKLLKGKLWGENLWTPSYFAGSCGGAPLEMIKEYIQSQQRPE